MRRTASHRELLWIVMSIWPLLAICGAAGAVTLVITSAGYWQLTVDANGTPVLTPFDEVIRLEENDPIPPPLPNGDPATLTEKVAKWSTQVNEPEVAQAQGLMMEFAAEQGSRGTFATKSAMTRFTKVAIPRTLNAAGSIRKVEEWNVVWNDLIWPAVRAIEAAGQMNTLDDQVRIWRQIATGFKATATAQWNLEFTTVGGEVTLAIKGEANPFLEQLLKILFQLLLEWLTNNPVNPGVET